MEPALRWAANPNVTVAIKAFGLKATAQVVNCFTEEGKSLNSDLLG